MHLIQLTSLASMFLLSSRRTRSRSSERSLAVASRLFFSAGKPNPSAIRLAYPAGSARLCKYGILFCTIRDRNIASYTECAGGAPTTKHRGCRWQQTNRSIKCDGTRSVAARRSCLP